MTYKPTCPVCVTEMQPRYFVGYYESFVCWTCECTSTEIVPPGSTVMAGAYSGAKEGAPVTEIYGPR